MEVLQKACPLFVPAVEEGILSGKLVNQIIKTYLDDFKGKVDTLILGCTHYPLLKDAISKIYPDIKIVDPACGSGAFLITAFEYLLNYNNYLNDKIFDLTGVKDLFSDTTKEILQNNIFGVDLNKESVEITKLSLWLKTADKNKTLASLENNIKCGNSLIDDPEIAGNLAFNWEKEFPEIFANGGFDIVVGNPPYVKEDIGKNAFNGLHQHLC